VSRKHPIVAVTGSSGAGTTSVKNVFEHIFRRENIRAAVLEGDSFHKYDREGMREALVKAEAEGRHMSHFGPEANLFEELEAVFRQYGRNGTGKFRKYLHDEQEAEPYHQPPGTFTEWEPLPEGTDLLFYEGLHGGVRTETCDVAAHVDLLIGVTPIVNLEWIQKMHRDMKDRGYTATDVTQTIMRRMSDYVHYIVPQFSCTHLNFQRVPTVDTSNPFVARDIPTADESFVVIRFRDPHGIDFPYLLTMVHDSFMSRPNCFVVPGGKLHLAMQLILTPLILDLIEKKRRTGSVTG